jgi:hypothetical protein
MTSKKLTTAFTATVAAAVLALGPGSAVAAQTGGVSPQGGKSGKTKKKHPTGGVAAPKAQNTGGISAT